MSARKTRERPRRRQNPAGGVVWVAQVNVNGRRRSLGTFAMRRDAQQAIDDFYDRGAYVEPHTFGAYAGTWTTRHPRGERTNRTNDHRLSRVLDVRIAGRPLRDWSLGELRRKHALELVAALLVDQGRSTTGAANILRTLSAMAEDAITDELAEVNPWRGVRVRANDPRAAKQKREPRVFDFETMHEFCRFLGRYEGAGRVMSDCGLRLGEALGLDRADFDGDYVHTRGNAHNGVFTVGNTPTKQHVKSTPVPPSTARVLSKVPARLDCALMFPTLRGKIWRERNFYRDVWYPAQEAWAESKGHDITGMREREMPEAEIRALLRRHGFDPTPHEFRHSWESLLLAAGVDQADLADRAGHSVAVMNSRYRHPLRRSDEQIRKVIG